MPHGVEKSRLFGHVFGLLSVVDVDPVTCPLSHASSNGCTDDIVAYVVRIGGRHFTVTLGKKLKDS